MPSCWKKRSSGTTRRPFGPATVAEQPSVIRTGARSPEYTATHSFAPQTTRHTSPSALRQLPIDSRQNRDWLNQKQRVSTIRLPPTVPVWRRRCDEIVAIVASLGLPDKEIARRLGLTGQGVRNRLADARQRLGLVGAGFPRGRLVRWAWAQPDWPEVDARVQAEHGSFAEHALAERGRGKGWRRRG